MGGLALFSVATVESATGRAALERALFQSKKEFWSSATAIMGACQPRTRGRGGDMGGIEWRWFGAGSQVSFSCSKMGVQSLKHPSISHRNSFKTHMGPARQVGASS